MKVLPLNYTTIQFAFTNVSWSRFGSGAGSFCCKIYDVVQNHEYTSAAGLAG